MKILFLSLLAWLCGCSSLSNDECENGKLDNYEDCDQTLIAPVFEKNCLSYGYHVDRNIGCKNCKLDFSVCEGAGKCRDGVLDDAEECDNNELRLHDCADLGYYGGFLACNDDCTYDISPCQRCGDDVVQESEGEVCDGKNYACPDDDYFGGPLVCTDDCSAFNYSSCDQKIITYGRHEKIFSIGISSAGNLMISGQTGSWFDNNENADPTCPLHDFGEYVSGMCDSDYFLCLDAYSAELDNHGQVIKSLQWGTEIQEYGNIIEGGKINNNRFSDIKWIYTKMGFKLL